MLHRTCPRWQFQRWCMKLTAPAFDRRLHSLWIWKEKLERMLAGHSWDNLHPCAFKLVSLFKANFFDPVMNRENMRNLLACNLLAVVYRIADCYILICMAKSELILTYHNYVSYQKTSHYVRTHGGHIFLKWWLGSK